MIIDITELDILIKTQQAHRLKYNTTPDRFGFNNMIHDLIRRMQLVFAGYEVSIEPQYRLTPGVDFKAINCNTKEVLFKLSFEPDKNPAGDNIVWISIIGTLATLNTAYIKPYYDYSKIQKSFSYLKFNEIT